MKKSGPIVEDVPNVDMQGYITQILQKELEKQLIVKTMNWQLESETK